MAGDDEVHLAPALVDTAATARAVNRLPATIRMWAHRGYLQRRGTDRRGRALYALEDVYACDAERRRTTRRHPAIATPQRKKVGMQEPQGDRDSAC